MNTSLKGHLSMLGANSMWGGNVAYYKVCNDDGGRKPFIGNKFTYSWSDDVVLDSFVLSKARTR